MATFNAHMKTLTFMLAALFISCVSLSAYAEEMSTLYPARRKASPFRAGI